MVASLHSGVRRSETLAAILQVPLMLHLPSHGGVPVILDGVVRAVGEKISNILENSLFHDSNWEWRYAILLLLILPSRKKLGDLRPAVAKPLVGLIDDSILFLSP